MNDEQSSSDVKSDSELIDEVLEQIGDKESSQNDNESDEVEGEVVSEQEEASADDLSVEEMKRQLKQAQKKVDENWDKAVRIQAELENYKRRSQKDLENAHKYGLEKFAKELLSVIDSLELGIQASTSDNPEVVTLREGSELTIKQFEAVFAKFNIEAIDPVGEIFNPELHQAMTMQPNAEVAPNTVLNVFQKGYNLNGRLIRPAMVVVSQAMASSIQTTDESSNDATN